MAAGLERQGKVKQPPSRARKILWWVINVIVAVILVASAASFIYMGIPMKATSEAYAVMKSSSQTVFTSQDKSETDHYDYGLVFYPGAKCEPAAYAPLMQKLADDGWLCILEDSPYHDSLMNTDAAEQPIADHPNVDHWYVGGHSLGGVAASYFAKSHADSVTGVVFCASFPNVDLSQTDLDAISIYGTQDGVLDLKGKEQAQALMPQSFRELVIEGGNHAGFGCYGDQPGDNEATISADDQQTQTADFIAGK